MYIRMYIHIYRCCYVCTSDISPPAEDQADRGGQKGIEANNMKGMQDL